MVKIGSNYYNIWKGCITASVAHAIMITRFPELDYEQSWDGSNYSINDSQGSRGTISFKDEICLAAFRKESITASNNIFEALEYIKDAPLSFHKLAKSDTFQYLLENKKGKPQPSITGAFWGDKFGLYSMVDLTEMFVDGGHLFKNMVLSFEENKEAWIKYYEMNNNQIEVLDYVIERISVNQENNFILEKNYVKLIGAEDEDGKAASIESFAELGIKISFD